MFESVTKRRKNPLINIFGWTLLTVVCVVFVFIGFSPNSSFLGQGGAAAHVNGDAISRRDFQDIMDRMENNGQQGSSRDQSRQMRENALNLLISRSLIVQEAEDLNFYVSDEAVGQELLSIQPFYEDGQFSRLRYKNYLRSTRMTEGDFEDRIRRNLIIEKMSKMVEFAAKDLDMMDDFDQQIDQAQVNVGYVAFTPNAVATKKAMSSAEYLEKNQDKVKSYYETHKSEYAVPEQVKARHILIKFKDESEESIEAALKKVESIAKDLTVGNFAEVAKKESDDPGSKVKGGDLGFFPRGRMVPEFEDAAFSTEIGQITEPVKTKYGYHLILTEEKQEAQEKSFDDVKEQIASKLVQDGALDEALAKVRDYVKEGQYGDLESYISSLNLKWTNTGFFPITKENIPGVGNNKEFLDTAVQLGPEREYADRLVYQGETAYLLKFKGARMDGDVQKNNQMDFFKELMKQQKMNMLVRNWTETLRERAKVQVNPEFVR